MAEVKHPEVQIGMVFLVNIGYTSCHPVFMKVIRRTATQVVMKQLKSVIVSDDGYCQNGTMTAVDEFSNEKEVRSKLYTNVVNGQAMIKLNRYSGFVWNGQPTDFYSD